MFPPREIMIRKMFEPGRPGRLHASFLIRAFDQPPQHWPEVWCLDGSYLLFVEPRLIGNLDVVSVRVADVCREVVGTPFGPKARFLVRSSSRVYHRLVAGPDSVRALSGECDVK